MSWKFVKLESLVTLITKGTTPTSIGYEFSDSGVNFVKVESINLNGKFLPNKFAKINDECNEALKRSQLREGDILFSIAGALGRTAIVNKEILPANTNQALAIIRLKDENLISKEFLLRVLASDSIINQVSKMKGGVAQQNLSLSQLKDFLIPLPPLPTQKKIVAKLDAIFAEIDRATAAAEENAKNAEVLFQSYLAQVFESTTDEWSVSELGKLTKFIDYRGKTPTKTSDGIRLITAKNVKFGFLNKEPYEYISEKDYEGWMTRGIPKKGDVLFTTEAPLANVAQLDTDEKVVFAQRLIILQPQEKLIDSEFLKFSLLSRKVQNQIISKGTGATVKGIKARLLKLIPIEYPSLKRQKDICQVLADIKIESNKLKDYYTRKVSNLNLYKNSILKKAFSGELVKE